MSLERRWFGVTEPGFVLAGGEGWDEQQGRVDRYAMLGRDDIGLKLRNGRRIGLKVRRCRIDLADGLVPAERWTRLSARPTGAPAPDDPAWTAVVKRRHRRVADLSAPGGVAPATGPRRPARGGAVEVVSLVLAGGDTQAWSVAAEAWGPGDVEGLRRVMAWSGIDWRAVDSWSGWATSYPGWLGTWAAGGG